MEIRKDFESRFKMFGGDHIYNVRDYLLEYLDKDPTATVTIGNDSVQRRRKTVYSTTIMLYNQHIKNGAHVIFYRESVPKIYDTYTRLYREAEYLHELGMYLQYQLEGNYVRKDLTLYERKRYKFEMLREKQDFYGKQVPIPGYEELKITENMYLTDEEKNKEYKLVDIHLDFNPREYTGNNLNKSYQVYRASVPWLRGTGFRVFAKPVAWAATSAADLLLK